LKIALVCALNFDKNPGMVSVDRAAINFFSGRDVQIDWFFVGGTGQNNPGADDLFDFTSIFEAEGYPKKYDRIIFWGDFLQSYVHHESLIPMVLNEGYASNTHQARKLLRSLLLFENASQEILSKVVICGSSIHADGVGMLMDENFKVALVRLLAGARSVRMREPLSAYRATILSGRDETVGLDMAFLSILNNSWNVEAEMRRRNGPVRIAVVGGRSRHGRKLKFSALATMGAFKKAGIKAVLEILPWLSNGLGRWGWFSVETPSLIRSPDYCFERLNACDALITDVYHAAINAWIIGIPVILLGSGAELDSTAIMSKKKELLSLSLFAGENYLFLENISYFQYSKIGQLLYKKITSEEENKAIFDQRKRDVTWFWRRLEAEIGLPPQSG